MWTKTRLNHPRARKRNIELAKVYPPKSFLNVTEPSLAIGFERFKGGSLLHADSQNGEKIVTP